MRTHYVAALVVVLLGLQAIACGPGAKQRALKTTLIGVNAARDGFIAWDAKRQQAIVDAATSVNDGKDKLKTYRTKRTKLEITFAITYRVLATAALDIKQANVAVALAAALELYQRVRDLMGDDAKAVLPTEPGK